MTAAPLLDLDCEPTDALLASDFKHVERSNEELLALAALNKAKTLDIIASRRS